MSDFKVKDILIFSKLEMRFDETDKTAPQALESGKEFLPSINYSPHIYRLVPMHSNNALHTIDLTVYWKDIYNNLHPFQIGSNSHCDMKIMFRKKYLGA